MNAAARSNCARNRTSSLYSANASRARFINASASSVFSNLPTYTVTPTVVNSNNTNSKREMSSATVNSLARDIDRRRGSYSSAIAQSTSFSLKRGFPATITTAPPYGQQFHHINRGIASVVFKKNIFGDNTTTSNSRDPTKVAAHVEAAYQRGLKYHHGLGVDQNLEIALEAYQQAAFAGHAESCCALASMYANGEVAGWADYEKARQLYGIAALLGHPPAQFKLGEMYESGIGVGIDLIRAQSWYIEAAKRNYAPALCNLGTMYAEGDGCEPDPVRAVELLRMAADQGLADAQCCLGLMYLNGEGVEADEAMAEEYYMRAAEQGHALAQVNLGHLYYNQGNAEMAKECWELAAKQGVALALCNLGAMYMTGQGVQQSYIKAHEYYSQAAHKGDFEAQYQMGVLYENGHGVQKQPNTALSWFNKAAQQGHTEAKECALRLRGPLSSTNTTTIASTSTPPPSTQTPTGPTPPESISGGGKRNV